jgi:hypothetical protein
MKYALAVLFAAASVVACGSSEQMGGPVAGSGGYAGGGHGGAATNGGAAGGGSGGQAGAEVGGGGAGGAMAFAPVQAILDQYCVRCHDPAHPNVLETQTYVEMPLVASAAYAALVGVAAHETCGGTRVVAGDPEHSYLYRKVVDAQPCDGERMPHQGMLANTPPLSAADTATIRAWIAGGAHR